MKLAIIVAIILNTFATNPDLCAESYLDAYGDPWTDSIGQTLSRYCTWAGPDAPILDAEVCCNIDAGAASCWLPDSRAECTAGTQWHCKYGEEAASGIVCYRPYPDACDLGYCDQTVEAPPDVQEDLLCCNPGACQEIAPANMMDCEGLGGTISWCHDGMSNADGTVTCFD